MAKVGNVSPTGGSSDSIKAAVMGDLTPNLTLGQAAAAALGGTDDNLVVVLDLVGRTVIVKPAADAAKLKVPSGEAEGVFEPDDATKKVAPWTAVSDGEAIEAIANAATKPLRSLASLISALEDWWATVANHDDIPTPKVVVDQSNGKVLLFNKADVFSSTPSASLAEFEAPVATVSGTPRGPFE